MDYSSSDRVKPERVRLGEILIQQQLISEEQLDEILKEQKRNPKKLGRLLIDSRLVTEEKIAAALSRQLRMPFFNLRQYPLNKELVERLPEHQARRLRAIVLDVEPGGYLVGMTDPTDLFAHDELNRLLKKDVSLAVVMDSQLNEVLDRVYRRTDQIKGLARELGEELNITGVGFDFGIGTTANLDDVPVMKLLNGLFDEAIAQRASDIHVEPLEGLLQVRFRIDGVLHVQMQTDLRIAPALASRIKLTAGLDISEKRLPQDGRFNIKVRDKQLDVRISTMPIQNGESVVMRLLNNSGMALALNDIGMPPPMLKRFTNIVHRPNGLILVTGPTGSGKTTTLYSVLAELNDPETKIITVEDPVEYRMTGVNQVQVNEKIELSFARVLRSVLRQDPDVVLVGEMRDQETAQIGIRAALTGHMVLSTLHTNDAVSTPVRLLDMGVPQFMVASAVQAVVAQRLVRRICDDCKIETRLSDHEHEWLQHDAGRFGPGNVFKGAGCPRCNQTGYLGRMAVYEMLEMDRELIGTLGEANPDIFVNLGLQRMQGATIRDHALARVLAGETTISEAMRIANQSE